MRRQGDSEEEHSSDDEARSSDSEEELDSPARIYQSQSSPSASPPISSADASNAGEGVKEGAEKMDTSESESTKPKHSRCA